MSQLTDEMRRKIRAYFDRYPQKQAVTLPALHIVQDEVRHVPLPAIEEIADMLDLHPSQVLDTMSFYGFFRSEHNPLGKYRVWVCRSLSCMLRGGEELLAELCAKYNVKPGETTADGKLTFEFAECLGACEGAPCITIDDVCHLDITADKADKIFSGLK